MSHFPPSAASGPQAGAPLPYGWIQENDPSGRTYFVVRILINMYCSMYELNLPTEHPRREPDRRLDGPAHAPCLRCFRREPICTTAYRAN